MGGHPSRSMLISSLVFLLSLPFPLFSPFFFFNDTATTEIYTLSLHDALPIWSVHRSHPPEAGQVRGRRRRHRVPGRGRRTVSRSASEAAPLPRGAEVRARRRDGIGLRRRPHRRSEEHTSELQSHLNLVCRLLL